MFADLMRFLWVRASLRLQDRRAVTSIEYALIAALISVIIISALTTLGRNVGATFNKISSEL
jgi:pilus assembly protein Flp/PilA